MIKAQQRFRMEVMAASAVLAVGVCACGSSSSSSSTSKGASASSTTKSTAPAAGGKMHAVLTGQDHTPKATKPWNYTVRATSADGKPLAGTVLTEFAFSGQVVGKESPPTHKLKNGMLKDTIEFPKASVGEPVELQVVVTTSAGTQTLDWPVKVQP